ncbi:Uncharacterised protein [Serratia quinivorans]|uniref:Phage tail tape measure protein, TP901 family, core region n=1 Tax=Serratia quinivorans TaxID=137545 RepID=A0A380AAA5_9GAMM|nr:Uncharacterised protein [Serratia quinivorans]
MKQLDFTLSLIDKMTRPLKQAQSAVGNFAEKSQGNFRQIGVGAAAIWGVTQSIKAMLGPAYEMQHALDELSLRGVDTKALNTLASDANRFSIRYGKNAVEFVASASAIKGSIAGLTDTELPATSSPPIPWPLPPKPARKTPAGSWAPCTTSLKAPRTRWAKCSLLKSWPTRAPTW